MHQCGWVIRPGSALALHDLPGVADGIVGERQYVGEKSGVDLVVGRSVPFDGSDHICTIGKCGIGLLEVEQNPVFKTGYGWDPAHRNRFALTFGIPVDYLQGLLVALVFIPIKNAEHDVISAPVLIPLLGIFHHADRRRPPVVSWDVHHGVVQIQAAPQLDEVVVFGLIALANDEHDRMLSPRA